MVITVALQAIHLGSIPSHSIKCQNGGTVDAPVLETSIEKCEGSKPSSGNFCCGGGIGRHIRFKP